MSVEPLRLQKIIADVYRVSRREAEEWVRLGEVTVNGKTATLGTKAIAGKDHIKVRGKLMQLGGKKVVVVLFKPRGFLSHIPPDQKNTVEGTVYEFLQPVRERLIPIGRLDKDAEGVLLLTNDGELAQRLNLGKFEVPKIYQVKVDGQLDALRLKRLMHSKVEDKKMKIQEVTPVRSTEGKTWVRVRTTDTQNRLIRRMFENVGRPVDKIRRSQYAGITLKGLERGLFRYLNEEELAKLYKFVGLELRL